MGNPRRTRSLVKTIRIQRGTTRRPILLAFRVIYLAAKKNGARLPDRSTDRPTRARSFGDESGDDDDDDDRKGITGGRTEADALDPPGRPPARDRPRPPPPPPRLSAMPRSYRLPVCRRSQGRGVAPPSRLSRCRSGRKADHKKSIQGTRPRRAARAAPKGEKAAAGSALS